VKALDSPFPQAGRGPGRGVRPASVLQDLPPVWPSPLLDSIRGRRNEANRCLIVLDDDPMSGQALYDVPVLTTWNVNALAAEMSHSNVIVLLTDTRSLDSVNALARMREVGTILREASVMSGRDTDVALRGDSTLRGHFPDDMEALVGSWLSRGSTKPVSVFVPYFGEAGRITMDDTQYAVEGGMLLPVGETELARDPMFGYVESHLPSWIKEKTKGSVRANQIVSVSSDDLRIGGPAAVAAKLRSVVHGRYVVVNASDDRDLEVLADAIAVAAAEGRRFVTQSAAPFVRVLAGMPPRDLLSGDEVIGEGPTIAGGLTVVGSYIERTNEQLAHVLSSGDVVGIKVGIDDALYDTKETVRHRSRELEEALGAGKDAVLYLARSKRPPSRQALEDGNRLSDVLGEIMHALSTRPRYVMVKGGNTASRIATKGLGVRRATVLGQLLTGVPVWRLWSETRWPELPFVIFAGNVGERETLLEAIEKLRATASPGRRH
jgi:uncharacterized protein YgbK (DUF1537 family)